MGINDGEASVEIFYFNEYSRLEAQICDFFKIDETQLNPEKKEILQAFVSWLLVSIVYDAKQKSWKYKNFSKGERGSFTFPMFQDTETGFSSFAHMLHGGDPKTPWVHFDFDVFESGCTDFIQKMGIEFDNNAFTQAQLKFQKDVRYFRDALMNREYEKLEGFSKQAVDNSLRYRSRNFELLTSLGLDYGADSEGVCEIPMKYTLI